MDAEFVKTMNAIAEGTPKDITDATDDTTFERTSKDAVKLYRVSDASGSLEITEVGSYPLSRDLLDSNVSGGTYTTCLEFCMYVQHMKFSVLCTVLVFEWIM